MPVFENQRLDVKLGRAAAAPDTSPSSGLLARNAGARAAASTPSGPSVVALLRPPPLGGVRLGLDTPAATAVLHINPLAARDVVFAAAVLALAQETGQLGGKGIA